MSVSNDVKDRIWEQAMGALDDAVIDQTIDLTMDFVAPYVGGNIDVGLVLSIAFNAVAVQAAVWGIALAYDIPMDELRPTAEEQAARAPELRRQVRDLVDAARIATLFA